MARGPGQLWWGLLRFAAILTGWLVLAPAVWAGRRFVRRDRTPMLAWALPVLAERLGPAFVKFAQLASTRSDVLPASWCRAVERLREDGRPLPTRYVRRQLGAHRLRTDQFELVGAGSVAGVYAVPAVDGSTVVAVKLLRPRARRSIERDLRLIRWCARTMSQRGRWRHLPVVDMVEHITDAIAGQVDLVREQANLRTLHARLDPTRVAVPAPRLGGSTDLLVMEYRPEFGVGGREPMLAHRQAAAAALVDAVFHMLFVVGIVHCDLHPGNLRVAADGRVSIVDAGFVVATDGALRRRFCEFFLSLTLGNGPRCARSILEAAIGVPDDLDRDRFDDEVTDIVARYTGLAAAEFSIAALVDELFALQRRHRVFVPAAFVVPILTLLVIEGTVRAWDPELDFQAVAQPIIMSALATAGPRR